MSPTFSQKIVGKKKPVQRTGLFCRTGLQFGFTSGDR
jgi:hypothetical protein